MLPGVPMLNACVPPWIIKTLLKIKMKFLNFLVFNFTIDAVLFPQPAYNENCPYLSCTLYFYYFISHFEKMFKEMLSDLEFLEKCEELCVEALANCLKHCESEQCQSQCYRDYPECLNGIITRVAKLKIQNFLDFLRIFQNFLEVPRIF